MIFQRNSELGIEGTCNRSSDNIKDSKSDINSKVNVQAKSHPHRGTRGGGLVHPPAFLGFRYVTIFRKGFTFSRKPTMCSTKFFAKFHNF